MGALASEVTLPVSCWADNRQVIHIARQVEAMISAMPEQIGTDAKTEIRERDGYVQVLVVCTFRIPK